MERDAYGRLDENQFPIGRYPLGPDTPSVPWAMLLTDAQGLFWFVCFDVDAKVRGVSSPEAAEQAHDQADMLTGHLDALGIEYVLCASSARSGGRHIWVAMREGAPAAVVKQLGEVAKRNCRQLDNGMLSNRGTGAARPPGSPHRDGTSSRILRGNADVLLQPSTTVEQLQQLTAVLEEIAPAPDPVDTRPSGPVDFSHTGHRSLSRWGEAHMATIGGGSNPSWTGFMCLLAAATAGWTLQDAQRAAQSAPGMEHYRTKNDGRGGRRRRSPAEAAVRLERQWDKAVAHVAVQGPAQRRRLGMEDVAELVVIVDQVEDLLQRIDASPGRWGRNGTRSQATIAAALAYLTLRAGKHAVAASIRDLALMTGLGRSTAQRALHALVEAGYVYQVAGSVDGYAAVWQLTSHFSTTSGTSGSHPRDNPAPPPGLFNKRALLINRLEEQLADQHHDVFSYVGLGHLAGSLYAMLANGRPVTRDTGAALLGVTRRHATTVFSRLRDSKLIVKLKDGWSRARRDLRSAASRRLGVDGYLRGRAERYAVEREVWQWWQAEARTMYSSPTDRPPRPDPSSRPLFVTAVPRGERMWPRYPRGTDGRGDHHDARDLVAGGFIRPESRWQYLGEVA